MKAFHFLLFLLLLVNCKRKDPVDPAAPVATEPAPPYNITDFRVEGVPQENIRFAAIYKDGPRDHVVITLPENYRFGDTIRVSMKLPAGYTIQTAFRKVLDSKGFSLDYRTTDATLIIVETATGNVPGGLHFIVDPTKPIVVPPVGHDYGFTLEGEDIYVPVPTLNWGTYQTAIVRGPNQPDSLSTGQALLRNLKTGAVTSTKIDNPAFNDLRLLEIQIPATIEAGEYETTLVRNNRRAIVPDRLVLKYGAPKLNRLYNGRSVYNDQGNVITYEGYNLLPGHAYELELVSDFLPKQRFPLVSADRLTLRGNLPLELTPGTYKSTLYIDGQVAMPFYNPIIKYNLISILKDLKQPTLRIITQPSSNFSTSSGFKAYEPATSLKRDERVLALYESAPGNPAVANNDTRLLFKNIETGKEYTLPQMGFTDGILPYRVYKSPDELPAGKYQVPFAIKYTPDSAEQVSGLYYSEIGIE